MDYQPKFPDQNREERDEREKYKPPSSRTGSASFEFWCWRQLQQETMLSHVCWSASINFWTWQSRATDQRMTFSSQSTAADVYWRSVLTEDMLHFSVDVTAFAKKTETTSKYSKYLPSNKARSDVKNNHAWPCESHWHTAAHMLAQWLSAGRQIWTPAAHNIFVTNKIKSAYEK